MHFIILLHLVRMPQPNWSVFNEMGNALQTELITENCKIVSVFSTVRSHWVFEPLNHPHKNTHKNKKIIRNGSNEHELGKIQDKKEITSQLTANTLEISLN